ESRVRLTNGQPGLRGAILVVNSHRFVLEALRPGEIREIDVSRAMRPGTHNTVLLRGTGPTNGTADVPIWDGSGLAAAPPDTSGRPRHRAPLRTRQAPAPPGATSDDALLDWVANRGP